MTNKIKLFLCLLFFSTNMHAEVNYNSVTTVRLNGVELVNPITPKQIDDRLICGNVISGTSCDHVEPSVEVSMAFTPLAINIY